jgi:diguanylate cyclase (GGDEF)-like protein
MNLEKAKHKAGLIIDNNDLRDLTALNLRLDGFDITPLERGKNLVQKAAKAKLNAIIITPKVETEGEVDPDLMRLSVEDATNDVPLILFVPDPALAFPGFDFILYDETNPSHPFDPKLLTEKVREACDAGPDDSATIEALNPLTGLPGPNWVDREISERLRSGEKFSMIFIDLDNFRSYNHRYSYQKGDEVIKATADLLRDVLESHPQTRNFLGHRGSDDFVILTVDRFAEAIGEAIVEGFDEMIGGFYEVQDLARGYVVVSDTKRNEVKAPIVTISAVILSTSKRELEHPMQVYEVADELLKYAKARGIQQSYVISEHTTEL